MTLAPTRKKINVRRRGIVYGAECFAVDPDTGFIRIDPQTGAPLLRIDYVGQSRQTLNAREEQHRDDKPFADLIVRFVIIEQDQWLNDQLDEREQHWIGKIKPRYNATHNGGNRERIEIWRQEEQRHARDRAAGRELWVPEDQRTPATAASRPVSPDWSVWAHRFDVRSWRPWQQKACLWSITWATTARVLWAELDRNDWLPPGRTRLLAAVLLPAVTLAVSLRPNRRQRRRRRRRR